MTKFRVFAVFTLIGATATDAAQMPECLPATPVPIRVSIAGSVPATDARLQGAGSAGLSVVAASDGRTLWSAAGSAPTDQLFDRMQVGFAGSLVALDLDGDGLHDRIYAGDLASRLWRFDLHHGAAAAAWASGGILADFSSPAGRAFVAAPDVSLSTSTGDSWFNIAIGTASLPGSSAGNRFYVLRDHAPFEAWSDADYARWTPLRERDLVHLAAPAQAALQSIQHGYFIELAHGDVLMPSLTVAGRAVLAIADSAASTATQCRVAISVAALELDSALDASVRTSGDSSRSWREILPGAVPIDAQFQLGTTNRGEALCTLGNAPVTACVVDTQPVKTWWLRGDAE